MSGADRIEERPGFTDLLKHLEGNGVSAQNASRYQTTAKNLEFLVNTNLAEARKAASANDAQTVYNFVAEIQALISSEHQEWILLSAREHALDPDKLRHRGSLS